MAEWIVNQDWDSYLTELSKDVVWGDENCLYCCKQHINVEISVISSIPGDLIHILTPAEINPRNLPTLLLGQI